MKTRKAVISGILLIAAAGACSKPAPQPTSIALNQTNVTPGECYMVTIGNAANMTIDVQYEFNGGTANTNAPWITLDADGKHQVCTEKTIPAGTYTVSAIRNTKNKDWVNVTASIDVK